MSALTEFLYPTPARRTTGAIVSWWEERRLAYNVAVGSAGLLSVVTGLVLTALHPGDFNALIPLAGVAVFGVAANVCYLLGPAIEVAVTKLWGSKVLPVGPALYRMGLTFSVGLALLPSLIFVVTWVVSIVVGLIV